MVCTTHPSSSGAYLGRPGALTLLPWPAGNRYDTSPTLRGGVHELAAGGSVRDRGGLARRWVLGWPAITDDDLTTLRVLFRQPGPYRWLDPFEVNRLTANQSTGTDDLRDTTGHRAVTQGAVTSSTAQAHSDVRSLEWDTGTALTVASGRGVAYSTRLSAVDKTWTAVRPSLAYTFSLWARASVAVSMAARIDWYTAAGVLISSDTGAGTAVSTSGWTQLICANKTSPSTAAYAIAGAQNTTTTAAALILWLDDAQLEEGAAATGWRLGAGTPLIVVDTLAERMLRAGLREAELALLEVSA